MKSSHKGTGSFDIVNEIGEEMEWAGGIKCEVLIVLMLATGPVNVKTKLCWVKC